MHKQQCCSPYLNGGNGWGFFNAILGWTNSATYGSVISYNVYWIVVIVSFVVMRYHEVKGHWPLLGSKAKNFGSVPAVVVVRKDEQEHQSGSGSGNSNGDAVGEGRIETKHGVTASVITKEV